MKIAEQVSVTITRGPHAGKTLLLDVEEFQPIEPSNYCWTAGWNCAVEIRGETVWFFVDEAGVVWFENQEAGICPAQEKSYADMVKYFEGELSFERCKCGDPGDCSERNH